MTKFTYFVKYNPAGINVDITNYVQTIEITDVGTGEVRSARLLLNANRGAFVTNTLSGATPIISQFDRIRIQIVDRLSNAYDAVYEVDILKPIENAQQGTVLEVQLLGLEHHLLKVPFTKQYFFESAFGVSSDIINIYNSLESKGQAQPLVTKHDDTVANTLPQYTATHYLFNVSEKTIYDALIEVVDRMGSSVAAGGGGDFWELYFSTDFLSMDDIVFSAFKSGVTDSGVVLDDTVAVNPAEQEGGIHAIAGNVTATWGADTLGSLPPQVSKFAGALEAWRLFVNYDNLSGSPSFAANSIVQRRSKFFSTFPEDNLHWKANKATTSAPPTSETSNTDWDLYNFVNFLTNEIAIAGQYSPWTNAQEDEWRNSGANVAGNENEDPPTASSVSLWDANQVVVDGTAYRTWVDWEGTTPASIPTQYLYSGTDLYRGFRALVNGTGSDAWASFSNEIVQYDGLNWYKVRNMANGSFCAVDHDAKVYKKNSGTWSAIDTTDYGNDCYHPYLRTTNTQGHNNKSNGAGGNFGEFSAVTYHTNYQTADVTAITSRKFYRMGAWINLKFPFPHSTYNAVSPLGEFWGNNSTKKEPVTLDINNMHLTHSGKQGFNHLEADEYGPIDGIRFMTKFKWWTRVLQIVPTPAVIDGSNVRAGNIPCRCWMIDTEDNVVVSDFTISFNDQWEQIFLPISSFKIYRARAPWSLLTFLSNVFLQNLEILNVFNFRNIKKIGFQWMGPYDDEGRYAPFLKRDFLFPQIEDPVTGLLIDSYRVDWSIDAFHFAKSQLAVSPPQTGVGSRAIFPKFFQEPLITNSYQLKQANLAKNEITKFQHKQFDVVTEGLINIDYGETFHLKNTALVNDADGGANRIKLVAKKIKYEITKPPQGVGGFLRTITGVKRFS